MTDFAGKRVAIANRAEIAVRIAATCRRLGAVPILLAGRPDLNGFAARQIGHVEMLGVAGSELDVVRVIEATRRVEADYLHPGYGFLSERAELADACDVAGIRFVGPSAATLRLCGNKLETREAAVRAGVPVLAASAPVSDVPSDWSPAAERVGFPLLVKPADAGGGRGLRFVASERELVEAVRASQREVSTASTAAQVYLERAMLNPRHVEVQVAADGQRVLALGDRDCSIQRRHQKVIEEAPAPNVGQEMRQLLHDYSERIAREVGLIGIATCEFLLSGDGELAFLEVNPRIQVEHPVTELVTGIDLVEWQLRIAAGEVLPISVAPEPRGEAIEARIYAEDPWAGFFPTPGRLSTVSWPARPDVRIDAGYESGDLVPAAYDSMIAKVIGFGADRPSAMAALRAALADTIVAGTATNVPWLRNLLEHDAVLNGCATTSTALDVPPQMPDRCLAPVAAVAALVDRPSAGKADPWTAIGPFRTTGRATVKVHGEDWEERVTAWQSGSHWVAQLGGTEDLIRWWRDPAGVYTVAGGTVARFAVDERDGGLEVTGNGGRWLVFPGPKPAQATAREKRPTAGALKAPLPATVLGIHVAPGASVEPGQPVVTLYAMKMELVCEAPASGVVESIECEVGDLVDADQVLASLRIAEIDRPNDSV